MEPGELGPPGLGEHPVRPAGVQRSRPGDQRCDSKPKRLLAAGASLELGLPAGHQTQEVLQFLSQTRGGPAEFVGVPHLSALHAHAAPGARAGAGQTVRRDPALHAALRRAEDENSCHPERLQLLQENHQSKPDKQHEPGHRERGQQRDGQQDVSVLRRGHAHAEDTQQRHHQLCDGEQDSTTGEHDRLSQHHGQRLQSHAGDAGILESVQQRGHAPVLHEGHGGCHHPV